MKLYCYHVAPIDFWVGSLTQEQLNNAIDQEFSGRDRDAARNEVKSLKEKSESAFRTIGWEGDVRSGPFFFAVPGDSEMKLGYIVKQDNNGSCFIASPVPLPSEALSIFQQALVE